MALALGLGMADPLEPVATHVDAVGVVTPDGPMQVDTVMMVSTAFAAHSIVGAAPDTSSGDCNYAVGAGRVVHVFEDVCEEGTRLSGAAAGGAVGFVMEVDGVGSSGVVGLSLVGTESPATSAAEAAAMVAWPPTVVVGSDVCAAAVAAEGGYVVGDVVESRVALPEWGLRVGDQGVVEMVQPHQPDRVFVDWGGGPFIAFVDEVMFVRGGGALLAG